MSNSSISPNPPRDTDYVAMWYVARAAHGIGDNNWFGFATTDAHGHETIQWVQVPHRDGDGIGTLTRLLNARGYRGGEMPVSRDTGAPSLRALFTGWRRSPAAAARTPIRWRSLDAQRAALPHDTPPAHLFLSADDYARLQDAAKRAGVSSTNWLLWTLDRAVREVLVAPDATLPWVFPVNLRGAVPAADPHGNLCSGLTVALAADTTAADTANQVRSRLAALEHWRQWLLLTLGRWIGQPGVNLLYRLARGRPGAHAGSYSNLGRWPLPGMTTPVDSDANAQLTGVTCASPGSPAYPVSTGMVEWRGRLSLSCRVHPVATADPVCAERLLGVWRSLACGG